MFTILTSNTFIYVFVFVIIVLIEINIMEGEEHVIFGCPKYNTCRIKYPE